MAMKGCSGVVLEGSNTIAEVTAYDITEDAEEIDASVMGSCTETTLTGKVKVSGTINMYYKRGTGASDPAPDTAQENLSAGDTVSLEIRPNGTGSGKPQIDVASTVITQARIAGDVGGLVTYAVSFSGGTLTETAQ